MVSLMARERQQQAQKRALYPAQQVGQGNVQALSEMRESRERRRDAAGLHLPDVLALKINDPLGARASASPPSEGVAALRGRPGSPAPAYKLHDLTKSFFPVRGAEHGA